MKKSHILTFALSLMLALVVWAWGRSVGEARRLAHNFELVNTSNHLLRDSLEASRLSVGRLRLTVGELEEFRAQDAERIRQMDIKLRRAESLTKIESRVVFDTLLHHSAPSPLAHDSTATEPFRPILSDSLFELHLSDAWVTLDICSRPTRSHLSFTSRDTLFQVVHRVPHRWWIFAWGTKAIRQEIRSSNPHTRLVYAEYVELE